MSCDAPVVERRVAAWLAVWGFAIVRGLGGGGWIPNGHVSQEVRRELWWRWEGTEDHSWGL